MLDDIILIGTYKKKDYSQMRSIASDSHRMPPTYKEWKRVKKKAIKKLHRYGIKTIEIKMVSSELKSFCKTHHLIINKSARSAYLRSKRIKNPE